MRIRETQLRRSSEEWEARIGDQFRAIRIEAGKDQAALSAEAGISIGALRGLERGTGSTLRTLVRVARALDREDWLDAASPAVSVSPLDLVRDKKSPRTRVYRPRAGK